MLLFLNRRNPLRYGIAAHIVTALSEAGNEELKIWSFPYLCYGVITP